MNASDKEKMEALTQSERDYRLTHDSRGYALGSLELPNNRAGRRALARSWRGIK